ncbi:methylated-DNA--[protein]-cysteine S-methyltransferase [Pseudobacteriovorax antillogorgiicola]|uniref:methylated-DNA--[protein]-cysteine S-methyltransferase n=1 Tax=Pseudobacteriovorax antillogorgiicola TaxID=1513793 RepID=A0A1Y6BVW3_9BACT|nr:methylated-DNA--[protein]-cysteine S-methyltransferase [Pseudobacteriovorax antillogorgiicola]TCS53884.1 methylated-DNA-[protein]-cysteine S-methyltransferase [Pseudobacteriovorax antillogorgiicola]SMF21032.1 methylated-DNA-[protein]-cysteine S-methyltransferase [Pseudobacteriovorax antillogorgiicola]
MNYKIIATSRGDMAVAFDEEAVVGLVLPFAETSSLKQWVLDHWPNYQEREALPETLKQLEDLLHRYFDGEEVEFVGIPVKTPGKTEFQQSIYHALRQLKRGETVSYGELGERVGRSGVARAVGSCMANNPIPLLIPCHRVLPSSGKLGAFSAEGGPAMKIWMLRLEGADAAGRLTV